MRRIALLSSMAFALLIGHVRADQPDEQANFNPAELMAQMAKASGGDEKSDSPFPPFDKVTEGMESTDGMFKLWSYSASAKDKDSEKLLGQIPSGMLGQKFMLSTSFSGGGFFTGFPLDERVVQWEMLDDQVLLIEPETQFVVDRSNEVADVVSRTYPERIRVAVPIVTKSPGGDPLIDLGRLLKSSFADIGWMSMGFGPFGGMGGGGINSSLSRWAKKKSFPENMEFSVELAVSRGSPPGSYDKKIVHYSFWKLPDGNYSPRVADDRIGYFLTTNQDWSKPVDSRDIFNRYIDRWHLEKRDSSLPLCEPKHPIVFYIEKTVPVRFRHAVRDGILEWNKAFEKIGFLNAIEVRQQTDDNLWKDLDPEDMRYSFFRWIVAGAGFAMGPHRANPFTGQIYDADIIFDDAMVRYFENSAERLLTDGATEWMSRDPVMDSFLTKFPQWKRPRRDWESLDIGERPGEQMRQALRNRIGHRAYVCCDYTEGMKQQMAFSRSILADKPKEVINRFLYDVIKEVVMHEVGHTLGLRHNFKASAIFSTDQIKARRTTGEATVGSVMDYNPVLFFKEDPTEGHFITPTIGPYDFWAIEYGYRPFDQSYKSASKDPECTEDEPTEDAEPKEEAASAKLAASFDIDQIPDEVLKQIPPEVREMLASGKISPPGGPAPGNGKGSAKIAKPIAGEEAMLKDIASRSTDPLLVYATDEDTTSVSPDPRVNRFDMGSDPMEWAQHRMDLVNHRMDNLLDWAVKDDESWYHLRSAFQTLMFERLRVLRYVGRYVGGQYFSRAHKGDPDAGAPFELVAPELQRQALDFLAKQIFSDEFFNVSANVLNHLAPSRWWHQGTSISFTMDYPIHDMIGALQWVTLMDRMFPTTLRRIHDAEMKTSADDKFTLAEYIQTLHSACWHDAINTKRLSRDDISDARPFISDVRRSLQREYLSIMEPLVRYAPGMFISADIHAMLKHSLRNLSKDLESVIKSGKADFASQAHLVDCKSRIDRMLDPELKEYGMP